jgi:endonuclease YncB( thermonuclease family)
MRKVASLLAVIAYVALSCSVFAGEWVTLTNCRLLENASNDGDSFHVMHEGEEYLFRLYFVDCPESEDSLPQRIEAQSKDFGLTAEAILAVGKAASNFTQQVLSRPFHVITRWQKAPGRSRLQRYYAFVEIQHEIPDLNNLLLTTGLARLHGVKVSPSPDLKPAEITAVYGRIEAEAKAARRGAWGASKAPVETSNDSPRPVVVPNDSVRDEEMYDYTTADGVTVRLKKTALPPPRDYSQGLSFDSLALPSPTPRPIPRQLNR